MDARFNLCGTNIFTIGRLGKSKYLYFYSRKTAKEENIDKKHKRQLELIKNKKVIRQNKNFFRGK